MSATVPLSAVDLAHRVLALAGPGAELIDGDESSPDEVRLRFRGHGGIVAAEAFIAGARHAGARVAVAEWDFLPADRPTAVLTVETMELAR
jgi:hypothetical protein